jgi:hypothetical protein
MRILLFFISIGFGLIGKDPIHILQWWLLWRKIIRPIGHMRILLNNFMQNFTVNKDHSYPSFYQKCYFPLDPNEWADIFAASGAKYVQLITL